MKDSKPFDNNENDIQLIKEIAEYCWWKFRTRNKISEKFKLSVEQVDKFRNTTEYREHVLSLMISQFYTREEFNRWIDRHQRKYGDMQNLARRTGLKKKVISFLIERAREALAKIAAGELIAPEAIADPYERLYNYKYTLYKEQEQKCKECQLQFDFRDLEMDHIMPRSRGGADDLENFQLLCRSCNRSKGNRTQEEWDESKRKK